MCLNHMPMNLPAVDFLVALDFLRFPTCNPDRLEALHPASLARHADCWLKTATVASSSMAFFRQPITLAIRLMLCSSPDILLSPHPNCQVIPYLSLHIYYHYQILYRPRCLR